MLLHIEIQGDTAVPAAFAERMYTYFYRIRDRYHKPVSAVAIFTGQDGRDMPNRYAYHYRGTRLIYEYPTVSVLDYSDEELESSNNPFAQVIIAARIRLLEEKVSEDELLNIKLLAARKLHVKGFDRDKIRAVFTFLRNYVLFEKPEMNRKFDDLFAQTDKKTGVMNTVEYLRMEGREEGLAEGLKRGLKKGREEATRAIVENLLRNSDYPIEKIASSCGVSIDFVNDIKRKIC